MAMEDFRVDVVVGKGPGATAIPLEINPFTLVGATTRAGPLTGPPPRRLRPGPPVALRGAPALRRASAPLARVRAAARPGLLAGPLRDRFGFVGQMEFYEPAELQQVLARSADLLGVALTDDGAAESAGGARGA